MKHLPPPLFVLLVGFTLGLGVGSIANYYLLKQKKDELLSNLNNLHVESIYNLNTNESILTFKSVHQRLCGEYIGQLASSPLKEINVIINGVRFARSKTHSKAENACLPDDGFLGQNELVLYSAGRSK